MAVPYAWLIASLLLMTFFALAWPFADLLFAPASLPLRPRHLVTHYFCGLSLCALVTLGLLLVAGYRALEKRLDNQMKWVAADMHANFQAELEAIAAQIARFDKQYLTNANDETSILANPALCALPPVTSNGAATYPGFNMIVWIDKNGMQTNKWTKEGRKTENINVGRREYFQNAMAGRVWTKEINTEPWRFFIDPIYSWNTGQNDAVVAHHRGSESVPIVSLDVRFQTFFHPVLPVDLGFCVIDESGKVLFHSDEGRNLRENFIVECNNNPKIRRAIQGRTAEALDAEYLSKSCSLFLSPIQDLPWTLVIFREEQKLQTLLLETSFAVLILYTFALVILFGAVTALVLLTRDRRWLWPDAWRRNRYQILTAVNLLFGAIFLWVLPKSASIQTVLVEALLVPAITLFGNWLILRFSKPLLPESRRPRNPARGDVVWYCAALASLIVAASVVPTGRFFALIFNGETELLVRRGQMHFAKQMDERKHRLRSEYARLGGEPKLVNRFLTDLLTSTPNDCFITNFFETRLQVANVLKVCRPDDKPTESVFQMDSLRPLFDETARESSAYISNGDMAGFWHWDYSNAPAKILTLYREETDQDKKPGCWGMVISSRPWSLKQTDGWRWLGVGLGCLAVAALVAWRLYADFFRLKGKTPAPTPGFYLILGEQGRKPPDGYNVISRENQSGEMKSAGDKRERIWIENFHLDAHDPKASQKKLRFLRRCVSNPVERVVIHSRIHPLNFAFDAQPDSDSAANQRLAWSQILLHFRTCFAGEMRRLLREPKARDFESIWAICSPNEKRVLHEIAQNMLVNPKQPEIKTLIRNGLVTLSPGPCLSNDKFGKWIRESAAAAELPRFKLLPQEDRFASIKGPLIFGLVACALIFFLTQRALWDHTVALVPGFLAGLAAVSSLWKALGEFKSGKTALADDKTAAGSDSSG